MVIGALGVPTALLGGPKGSAWAGFAVFFAGAFAGAVDVAFAGAAAWVCACAEAFSSFIPVIVAPTASVQLMPMHLQQPECVFRFNAAPPANFGNESPL